MALLDLNSVSVRFGGVRALSEVSLSLERSQILGLVGPNGAGKTTLFNCITGMVTPTGGDIRFDGRSLLRMKIYRRARLGIARTFQNLRLFERMTVAENLMTSVDASHSQGMLGDALRLPGARYQDRRASEHALAMLHLVGLLEYASTPAGDLPVGMQRRVELARALCLRPRMLCLDEPAAGLDPHETAELAQLLFRVRERLDVSLLVVDHDMALIMRVCSQLYVLDFGHIIASGAPHVIRDHPAVIRAYLGEQAA